MLCHPRLQAGLVGGFCYVRGTAHSHRVVEAAVLAALLPAGLHVDQLSSQRIDGHSALAP